MNIVFKKGQFVEIEKTELNVDRFVLSEDGKIIGRVIKNKGWSHDSRIEDPVDVQIKKKVGKTTEAIFGIARNELKLIK